MNKLQVLDINNTDIDSGLEYLDTDDDTSRHPLIIKKFFLLYFYSDERPEAKVTKISKALNVYENHWERKVKKWKEKNF